MIVMTSGRVDNVASYRSSDSNFYYITSTYAELGWYGNTARALCWIAIGRWK